MRGLTSEFGMGSGISPSLLPPEKSIRSLLFTYKKQRLRSLHTCTTCDLFYLMTIFLSFRLKFMKNGQAVGPISIGQLNISLCLHSQPIYHVVYMGSLRGYLILREAWRLDAFNAYPFRT
jgi:hypothetical protein